MKWMGFYAIAQVQDYMMLCPIWCHLPNLKNMENTRGGVLLLVKLQAKSL